MAARAVVWAADHGPRELNVGRPTWRARLGNVLLPGLLDRQLAGSGYDSQQTETPIDPARWRDNLDRPGDDEQDWGAEGVFTDRSRRHSAALWVSAHEPTASVLALGGLLMAATGLTRLLR